MQKDDLRYRFKRWINLREIDLILFLTQIG